MPQFKYISDECINNPVHLLLRPGICSLCEIEKSDTSSLWRWPSMLHICLDCVANFSSSHRCIALRDPRALTDTNAPLDQFYELAYLTPPTPTFCEYLKDEVGWPRHCDDYCRFIGDRSGAEISDLEKADFANDQGIDFENVDVSIERGDVVVHQFECLTCNHKENWFDFSY